MNKQRQCVLLIDYINEIVAPKGKLAGKGYAAFVEKHGTLGRVAELLIRARRAAAPVIAVRLGFSPDYREHAEGSPLLGRVKEYTALQMGTWATEFDSRAGVDSEDTLLYKHRVSAFYGTSLDLLLRAREIREVIIAGVATDLAVESAVRDAHDRDYAVTVISDCCAAATEADHEQALRFIGKVATVKKLEELQL